MFNRIYKWKSAEAWLYCYGNKRFFKKIIKKKSNKSVVLTVK